MSQRKKKTAVTKGRFGLGTGTSNFGYEITLLGVQFCFLCDIETTSRIHSCARSTQGTSGTKNTTHLW